MTEPLLDPASALALTLRVGSDIPRPRLVVAGELDLSTTSVLVHALRQAEQAGHGRLEVDLGGVTFADCSGARPLVELSRRAAQSGGDVTMTHPSARVARVLAHLGLVAPAPRRPAVIPPRGAPLAPPAGA